MADNVYLLETRLSLEQQSALEAIRTAARQQGLTVFLVGGAVRDLMSGSPVRDLDVAVQGNALKLRADLEQAGAIFSGESVPLQSLYVRFPKGVRVEVGSTLSVTYPEPGKPVYESTTILEDLRRRDFTANAMALSLNEGSYGLLMDPLNGVADIENRELRLVSNYGFLEDPVRLIRAARFMARLGWQLDDRTKSRYDNAKEENYIVALQAADRGYEVEELFHEEEPLRVMRRLEEEGWLKHLSPVLGVAKVNAPELARLRETQMQLESRGIRADAAAANFPLLIGKIAPSEVASLKKSFPRSAFIAEIDSLETLAKELGTQLASKAMASPSEAYKLILRSDPVAVLWTMHSSKSASLQAKFKSFLNEWPQAQQKLPIVLMGEMRITPEVPGYVELQETLFYALMDGRLTTPEEMKAFLEPYSPPAPPPPISLKRPRAARKETKPVKSRKKAVADAQTQDAPEQAEAGKPESLEAVVPLPDREEARKPKKAVKNVRVESSVAPSIAGKETKPSKAAPTKKIEALPTPAKAAAKKPTKALPQAKAKGNAAKAGSSRGPSKPPSSAPGKPTKRKPKEAQVQGRKAATSKPAKQVARKPAPAKKVSAKGSTKKKAGEKRPATKKTVGKRK